MLLMTEITSINDNSTESFLIVSLTVLILVGDGFSIRVYYYVSEFSLVYSITGFCAANDFSSLEDLQDLYDVYSSDESWVKLKIY